MTHIASSGDEYTLTLGGHRTDGTTLGAVVVHLKGTILRFQSPSDDHSYAIRVEGPVAALLRDLLTGEGGVSEDHLWLGLPKLVPSVPTEPYTGALRTHEVRRPVPQVQRGPIPIGYGTTREDL